MSLYGLLTKCYNTRVEEVIRVKQKTQFVIIIYKRESKRSKNDRIKPHQKDKENSSLSKLRVNLIRILGDSSV